MSADSSSSSSANSAGSSSSFVSKRRGLLIEAFRLDDLDQVPLKRDKNLGQEHNLICDADTNRCWSQLCCDHDGVRTKRGYLRELLRDLVPVHPFDEVVHARQLHHFRLELAGLHPEANASAC